MLGICVPCDVGESQPEIEVDGGESDSWEKKLQKESGKVEKRKFQNQWNQRSMNKPANHYLFLIPVNSICSHFYLILFYYWKNIFEKTGE